MQQAAPRPAPAVPSGSEDIQKKDVSPQTFHRCLNLVV